MKRVSTIVVALSALAGCGTSARHEALESASIPLWSRPCGLTCPNTSSNDPTHASVTAYNTCLVDRGRGSLPNCDLTLPESGCRDTEYCAGNGLCSRMGVSTGGISECDTLAGQLPGPLNPFIQCSEGFECSLTYKPDPAFGKIFVKHRNGICIPKFADQGYSWKTSARAQCRGGLDKMGDYCQLPCGSATDCPCGTNSQCGNALGAQTSALGGYCYTCASASDAACGGSGSVACCDARTSCVSVTYTSGTVETCTLEDGAPCWGAGDFACRSRSQCEFGVCVCVHEVASGNSVQCGSNDDCCTGSPCQGGSCRNVIGLHCVLASDCTDDAVCNNGACQAAPCTPAGSQPQAHSGACCAGLLSGVDPATNRPVCFLPPLSRCDPTQTMQCGPQGVCDLWLEGLEHGDIAAALGIALPTVRVRLHRALDELYEALFPRAGPRPRSGGRRPSWHRDLCWVERRDGLASCIYLTLLRNYDRLQAHRSSRTIILVGSRHVRKFVERDALAARKRCESGAPRTPTRRSAVRRGMVLRRGPAGTGALLWLMPGLLVLWIRVV